MKSTTNNQHSFAQVPHANIQRSSFNRSNGWKGTCDSGYLIPYNIDEILPGDTFKFNTTIFGRMATPIYPLFDNMFIDTFHFFVPNRLVSDNWQKLMGEQDNPGDSTDYITPTMVSPSGGYAEESIYDYLGIPTKVAGLRHSSLPLRGINLIYNEWFRDQNLQDSLPVPKGDSDDDPAIYNLFRRGKRHDYFTSCLPWPQKGDAVEIPLGGNAPVIPNQVGGEWFAGGGGGGIDIQTFNGGSPANNVTHTGGASNQILNLDASADLSSATAATINQLRQAFQIQKMYERDSRGGSRYTEIVRSHFGVVSPDARLQRPEFLGGNSAPVTINPVAQTTGGGTDIGLRPLADLAATGVMVSPKNGFTKSFTEHGHIISFFSIRADLNYQQGLNRSWSREDRFDYYFPALAHLGEQEVMSREIYADGTNDDDLVFGYQERFAEYRYKPSLITGQFRSNATTTLDAWHLAQQFATRPTLSSTFIEENPPVDRVIATPEEPQFIVDIFNTCIAARPMPLFGVPGNIDRF